MAGILQFDQWENSDGIPVLDADEARTLFGG